MHETRLHHHSEKALPMAVAVEHQRQPSGSCFSPATPIGDRSRRHRLLSFPHPDLNLLDAAPSPNVCRSPRLASPATVVNAAALSFHRSLSTPCLSSGGINKSGEFPPPLVHHNAGRVEIIMGRRGRGVHALVVEAAIAMASGVRPVPAPSGLGGAYYLRNRAGEKFAVVKPASEEPLELALGQPGLRRSISVGETGVREVAAYLLDHGGFSGVPPTALIRISAHPLLWGGKDDMQSLPRPRVASIQRFAPHSYDAGDVGPSRFSVSSVHAIGILDVRLLNVDRHAGNILVREAVRGAGGGAAELVPIDHGLCLPELLDDPYFEWQHWPQAFMPFSEREVEYIAALDPAADAELLRTELPLLREASIRILVLCTTFLKHAAAAGLCLAEIGDMMTRGGLFGLNGGGPSSALEAICKQAELSVASTPRAKGDQHGGYRFDTSPMHEDLVFHMECEDVADPAGFATVTGVASSPQRAVQQELELGDRTTLLQQQHVRPVSPFLMRSISGSCRNLMLYTLDEDEGDDAISSLQENSDEELDEGEDDDSEEEENDDEKDEEPVAAAGVSLTRSVSFSVSDPSHHEVGGGGGSAGGRCMSFKGMNEEEWELFLERFEELLPKAFAARKGIVGLKRHRLGSSCKF